MTTATMEPTAEADLIVHEWAENGDCVNPERVSVDFGAKGKGRALTFLLGNTGVCWHVGWHAITKDDEHASPCRAGVGIHGTRSAALHAGLVLTAVLFAKDKLASKCIEAFFEKLGEQPTLINKLAASEGDPVRPPLPKGRFMEIPVKNVGPNPENHRKHFDEIAMAQLTASIKEHGLLQPIAVRLLSHEEAGTLAAMDAERYYEVILGERRLRAHVAAKIETIDAKVYEGVSRAQAKAAALVENLQRQDINAVEEAEGYADLLAAEGLTQEEVALRVGRSRPAVANALRLLQLPPKVLGYLREGKLTPAHGVALLRWRPKAGKEDTFPNWAAVIEIIAEEAVANGMTAGSMESGVPCESALRRAGLLCVAQPHEIGGEWPEEVLSNPAYIREYDWCYYCFAPDHWKGLVAAYQEAREAEDQRIAAAKAKAKGKGKIKSLEDLEPEAYEQLNIEMMPELTELLPEKSILVDLPRDADDPEHGRVTVSTAPRFTDRVSQALREAKKADAVAKVPELFEEAREKIRRIRKLDDRMLALVLAIALESEEYTPQLSAYAAKAQGVKLPAAVKTDGNRWHRRPDMSTKFLAGLASDAVGLARVLLDDWLVRHFTDDDWNEGEEPTLLLDMATDDVRAILCHLLEVPNLGLLEETKAGRKKLAAQVKALPWYAEARAEAEAHGDMRDPDALDDAEEDEG